MATDDKQQLSLQQEHPTPSAEGGTTQQRNLQSSPNPTTPTTTTTVASSDTPTLKTPATVSPLPPEPSSHEAELIHIPSYSRWFSWNDIYECEVRFLPEFFDERSPAKSPRVYKYYRNSIIRRYRENPSRKITFTEARKTIVGDVGSIRRVFDFLESWGLINYSTSASKPQLKLEDKDTKSNMAPSLQSGDPGGTSTDSALPKKRLCSGCKSVCSIACFSCDKYDLTLCARCYVRRNFRVGLNSSDFRRVEISEETKTDWTDKETLHLLEAILHYGDDWKKVSKHVAGRSEKDCVARFIKLRFGELFSGPLDYSEVGCNNYEVKGLSDSASSPTKRMRLTPLADASNPIMAQAAFLAAMVGVEVAEAAAKSGVKALYEVQNGTSKESLQSLPGSSRPCEIVVASSGNATASALDEAHSEAMLLLEKEEEDTERSIYNIVEVQAKEIQDKIIHFEEFELHAEREWQQLLQIRNMLFVDLLSLLFNKTAATTTGERMEENVKTER